MKNLRNLTYTDTDCSCPGKKILAIFKPMNGATIQLDIKDNSLGFKS